MNADLERLIALQKLDSTANAARRTLAAEPSHEQALEARLEAAKQHVADAKEKLAANKNTRGALEKDVAVHQGRLSKFREQAMAVKTTRIQQSSTKSPSRRPRSRIRDAILERDGERRSDAAVKTAEARSRGAKAIDADRRAVTARTARWNEAGTDHVERAALIAARQAGTGHVEAVSRKRNGIPWPRPAPACARSVTCACARRCSAPSAFAVSSLPRPPRPLRPTRRPNPRRPPPPSPPSQPVPHRRLHRRRARGNPGLPDSASIEKTDGTLIESSPNRLA
jgi:hypothetical protein